MSVCVVTPSRGRPQAAADLRSAFHGTTVLEDTRLLLALDDDDVSLCAYQRTLSPDSYVVGPRVRMGPTLNREAMRVLEDDHVTVVGFMGDDHRPRTPGWDKVITDILHDAPGVAYGDDLLQGVNLPTAVFISADVVRRLGYMAPPGLVHLWLDNFWLDLGRATNLHYRSELVFEHLHPLVGKAEWDAGYREANSDTTMRHDAAEYQRYVREDWPTERLKVC